MSLTLEDKKNLLKTGRTFDDVPAIVREMHKDADRAKQLERMLSHQRLVNLLVAKRCQRDMKQAEIAKLMGCTQSRVSKLESSDDCDLTLREIVQYADAIGSEIQIVISKKDSTLADHVRMHANQINNLLGQMVELAGNDEAIVNGVGNFFGDAFFNLLNIVAINAKKLPRTEDDSCPDFVIDVEQLNLAAALHQGKAEMQPPALSA